MRQESSFPLMLKWIEPTATKFAAYAECKAVFKKHTALHHLRVGYCRYLVETVIARSKVMKQHMPKHMAMYTLFLALQTTNAAGCGGGCAAMSTTRLDDEVANSTDEEALPPASESESSTERSMKFKFATIVYASINPKLAYLE